MNTWILLRGLMRETRHWGDFPARLQAALPHDRVLAIDLPGNGTLHRETSPLQVAEMVQCCRRQLALQGQTGPYSLVALSLGGMVATAWAGSQPDEIRRAVLINTSMKPFSPFYRRLRPQNYPSLFWHGLQASHARQFEQLLLRLTSSRADPAILPHWLAWRAQYPVSRSNALRQLLAAARFRAPRQRPDQPLLVLAGSADRLVDHRCSLALARSWQTALAVHPWAGHDLPLDDAGWVAEQIGNWVKQTPPTVADQIEAGVQPGEVNLAAGQ